MSICEAVVAAIGFGGSAKEEGKTGVRTAEGATFVACGAKTVSNA